MHFVFLRFPKPGFENTGSWKKAKKQKMVASTFKVFYNIGKKIHIATIIFFYSNETHLQCWWHMAGHNTSSACLSWYLSLIDFVVFHDKLDPGLHRKPKEKHLQKCLILDLDLYLVFFPIKFKLFLLNKIIT